MKLSIHMDVEIDIEINIDIDIDIKYSTTKIIVLYKIFS